MSRLEEFLFLVILSRSLFIASCSQNSHGSYNHFLDEKSYIYRSMIGLPNGEGEEKKPLESQANSRSFVPEIGHKRQNISNYNEDLYYPLYPRYSIFHPEQQQEIYKRNVLASTDFIGPPAPLVTSELHYGQNYVQTSPYSTYQPRAYVTNYHYPPVYISPQTSPELLYRYSPTPVPYNTPTPVQYNTPTPVQYNTPGPIHYNNPTLKYSTPIPVYNPPSPKQSYHHQDTQLAINGRFDSEKAVSPPLVPFNTNSANPQHSPPATLTSLGKQNGLFHQDQGNSIEHLRKDFKLEKINVTFGIMSIKGGRIW